MKEDFLHYVWKHQLFSNKELRTTDNVKIEIVHPGIHNFNSGPDFFNSKIQMRDLFWAGNVELHLKSSDWYVHQHEKDSNYDSVILHVVLEDDVDVFNENNKAIPTLALKGLIDANLIQNYQRLLLSSSQWIPCEKSISQVDLFVFDNWKSRLYFERLEDKSILIHQLLKEYNNNYEAVLFIVLLKNFGLKTNGEAFLNLAKSIDYSILQKSRSEVLKVNALLFGQAGFLQDEINDTYFISLKKEFNYLQHKFKLEPIFNGQFQFFRLRPSNFPTVRIAQIAALYVENQNLFSKLMSIQKLEDFYAMFKIELDPFWKTHYTFQKTSPIKSKKITKSFVDLLLINTILPLKFNYLKSRGEVDEEPFLQLLQQLKPEKNAIITSFSELKIPSKNAFDSQSLLQLRNNYCAKKRCLQCAIGNHLLRNS